MGSHLERRIFGVSSLFRYSSTILRAMPVNGGAIMSHVGGSTA